jgi:hypothetical protein
LAVQRRSTARPDWEASDLDVLRTENDEALHLIHAARGIFGCEDPMTNIVADAECLRQLVINYRGALSRMVEAYDSGAGVALRVEEARAVLAGQPYEPVDRVSKGDSCEIHCIDCGCTTSTLSKGGACLDHYACHLRQGGVPRDVSPKEVFTPVLMRSMDGSDDDQRVMSHVALHERQFINQGWIDDLKKMLVEVRAEERSRLVDELRAVSRQIEQEEEDHDWDEQCVGVERAIQAVLRSAKVFLTKEGV